MSEGFFGRSAEQARILRLYRSERSECLVLYGRRRVGKTELLLRTLEDYRDQGPGTGLYYVGKTAPAPLQIRELLQEAARALDEPLLATMAATTWQHALEAIVERHRGPGKLVPNQSFIAQAGPRRAFRERIAPAMAAFEGLCFENLCRQALPLIHQHEGIATNLTVGQYWDKHVQIDLVGVRDDGWADLGECRWGTVRSAKALREELSQRVARWPNDAGASIQRRFFVRRKPARLRPSEGERWHDLDDLYAAGRAA